MPVPAALNKLLLWVVRGVGVLIVLQHGNQAQSLSRGPMAISDPANHGLSA